MGEGKAIIKKREEDHGTVSVLRRAGRGGWAWKDKKYKRPSGQVYLDRMLRLLRKQGVRHRVLERANHWEVRWVA